MFVVDDVQPSEGDQFINKLSFKSVDKSMLISLMSPYPLMSWSGIFSE